MTEIKEISPLKDGIKLKISLPGSKSLTHRALIVAALAEGSSHLKNVLLAEDTSLTLEALRQMGVNIKLKETEVWVKGTAGNIIPPSNAIYLGNSGTSMRLLTGVCALGQGRFELTGNERMKKRPIQPLLDALKMWGVKAYSREENGCPPVVIETQGIIGGITEIDASISSQFVSALLLAAPYALKPVVIRVKNKLVSAPYVDLTLQVMKAFGVEVVNEDYKVFKVKPGGYHATDYLIEGDCSTASYFWAAAAILKGEVTVWPISKNTSQADFGLLQVLAQMGCQVEFGDNSVTVKGRELEGIEVDMNKMPDVVPTLAVIAAFAKGKTVIKNIAHLRHKECDRIKALATELKKMQVRVEEGEDYLAIYGGRPQAATIETYDDHRIAMSFAIAGLKVLGIKIINPQCVKKSFPGFWQTPLFA